MNNTAEQLIKNAAAALNGQTASVNLVGGQTLTGTLAYATVTSTWGTTFLDALTVTVSTKVHTVRIDHVSSVGQG
ncbi:hypothetical protein [Streptomyces sp. NPDC005125]